MMEKAKQFFSKIQYNSPVVLTYSLLSFAVLLLSFATGGKSNALLFSIYKSSWADPTQYIRLFLHVLGHANFEHFFNNFLIILLAGPLLEEKYGSKIMVFMILVTALVTGLVQVLFMNTALLGASGVVFMFILLSSFVNLKKGKIPVTLVLCLVVFVGREIYDSFAGTDNVSQISHIIGGLCGAAFGYFINRHKLTDMPSKDESSTKNPV